MSRGQAEVLGFSLLTGLTIIGVTAVVVIGATALTDMQLGSEIDRAEHSMTQLDSQISLVALGSSESHQSVISQDRGGSQVYVDESEGWMNVSIVDESGNVDDVIMNETLGAVLYELDGGETTIAYQGGGVWKKDKSGSAMVSPPEFHYRTDTSDAPTLTLPLVTVRGSQSIGDRAEIMTQSVEPKYPLVDNSSRSNPLENGTVVIRVHSTYYQAWGNFFESRTGGTVSYEDDSEIVIIELVIPDSDRIIDSGMDASGAGETLEFAGSGSKIDSYNSTNNPYSVENSSNAILETAGDLDIRGGATVEGDARSGAAIDLRGNSEVTGTAYYTTGISGENRANNIEEIDGVESPSTVGSIINEKITEFSDNDLGEITNDKTISVGKNYTEGVELGGDDTLILETGNEDEVIELAVDGDFVLDGGTVEVNGNGEAHLYVGGDITLEKGANVTVLDNDDVASQFWLYGTEDTTISIEGSSGNENEVSIVGVIYAPSNSDDDGSLSIQHAKIYGAIVAGDINADQGAEIHQDLALRDYTPFPENPTVPHVTYLHVSVNPVTINSN